ncbi:DUF5977 domain-containing protein [Sphingobacterium sp.]|uniref:DUF5977 domain-containing protein n=1 Tax=Sphingobacterium sp. TaxID=341027 RepID=UPI002FDEC70F
MTFELASPITALALTAGPTAPEATSFEPVDTTDMVNPLTGSFTYNLPLLEVPGPEGGYPLSLSYHAGIRPDVEASWVGLGWTLNPGAVNRNVAGLPDDFHEVNMKRRDYWSGGNRKEYGISVGFANAVNVGLVFASDTYQGFGVGASVGYGMKWGPGRAGIDAGIGPYGGGYVGMSVSSGYGIGNSLAIGPSLSVQTNFESVSAGAGVGLYKSNGQDRASTSILSTSMASSSNKPSLAVMGGTASVYNQNAGRISTSSTGFGFTVPIGKIFIGVSFRNTRYWIDETVLVPSTGSLYTPTSGTPAGEQAYDNYRLVPDGLNIADELEDYELLGGTFPEYDNYSVTGQGIGGQIRPFLYARALKMKDSPENSRSNPTSAHAVIRQGAGFRFVNEFSNAFDQVLNNIPSQAGHSGATISLPFNIGADPDKRTGNELTASKFVKYFTNDEIRDGSARTKGFIDVGGTAKGFQRINDHSAVGNSRSTKGGKQIGGFMVTNESGITYHYALPVYSYDEYSHQFDKRERMKFTTTQRKEPYAYTWLLTAVTGPDYVDRNGNGLVDAADWGYWVAMDYGKWSNSYMWRTPAEGLDPDLDRNYLMFSSGYKQLYYLNRIRTRSHTAIFEKEVRLDAKGSTAKTALYPPDNSFFDQESSQALRLNRIFLFNNADANLVRETSGQAPSAGPDDLYNNVIDIFDIAAAGTAAIEARAIRIIEMGYSYDLSKGTPNSFNIRQPKQKLGKLTLDGIRTLGKGGAELLPPTTFSYNLPAKAPIKGKVWSNRQFTSAEVMELGTMLEGPGENPEYYGTVSRIQYGGEGRIYTLANGKDMGSSQASLTLRETKNPSYCRDCHDIWGYYKGDINTELLDMNEDLARRTSQASARGSDAWNLRSISTPTGSSIRLDYESNDFRNAVFERKLAIPLKAVEKLDDYNYRIEIMGDGSLLRQGEYNAGAPLDGILLGFRKIGATEIMPTMLQSSPGQPKAHVVSWAGPSKINIRLTQQLSQFQAGSIYASPAPDFNYGGGPRIKTVSTVAPDMATYTTEYTYSSDNMSTGVTCYVPINMDPGYFENIQYKDKLSAHYKRGLNQDLENVLKYAREIPGPGIMYEKVTIRNRVVQPNGDSQREGYTENHYRVMDRSMIGRKVIQDQDWGEGNLHAVNLTIRDLTTNIGDLKGIRYYDADGRLIRETKNSYLYDEASTGGGTDADIDAYKERLRPYAFQGLLVERFAEARYHSEKRYKKRTNAIMAAREQYPSVMLSSTTIDYVNGTQQSTQNLAFDFMNGLPSRVLSVDAYGNRFLQETGFAYSQYPEMGNRLTNLNNKNMLTQVYSRVNAKAHPNNSRAAVISATRTTWGKNVAVLDPVTGNTFVQNNAANGNIWRKVREDVLEIPDQFGNSGMLPANQFSMTGDHWKLLSAISLYNVFSKPLEDHDRNNNYSANRYGYSNSRIVAGATFSRYRELAFSGAEDELLAAEIPGEISRGEGTVTGPTAHTGSRSLLVSPGKTGFVYTVPVNALTRPRTYVASAWVKNAPVRLFYEIDGNVTAAPVNSAQSTKKSGDWSLISLEIPLTAGTQLRVYVKNEGGASAYVDDFRFHPKNSTSTAYVYDAFSGELTHILDHNNLYTRFEYDAAGRLIATYKEQFGRAPYKTAEHQVNYANTGTLFYNTEQREAFKKNDCGDSTKSGEVVDYVVAAGKFSSKISVQDANRKARTDIALNGQQHANQVGRCSDGPTLGLSNNNVWNTGALGIQIWQGNQKIRSLYFPSQGSSILIKDIPAGIYRVETTGPQGVIIRSPITGEKREAGGTFDSMEFRDGGHVALIAEMNTGN